VEILLLVNQPLLREVTSSCGSGWPEQKNGRKNAQGRKSRNLTLAFAPFALLRGHFVRCFLWVLRVPCGNSPPET